MTPAKALLCVRAPVCGLPDGKWENRRYLILRGYIDDSGSRGHSPVLVLGGWISPVTKWLEFIPAWQAMLAGPPPIEYFKMNEAAKLNGQFRDWSEERANERVLMAWAALEPHVAYQVSTIIRLEPFYRIFGAGQIEKRFVNPYYLAFASIITDVAWHQKSQGIAEEIDFIFDDQAMEKGKIAEAWDAFRASADPEIRDLIGSFPSFQDDKKFLPLQAADFMAWWVRKMATEESDGKTRARLPWKAKRNIPGFQMHYDEARLKIVLDRIVRTAAGENPFSPGESA